MNIMGARDIPDELRMHINDAFMHEELIDLLTELRARNGPSGRQPIKRIRYWILSKLYSLTLPYKFVTAFEALNLKNKLPLDLTVVESFMKKKGVDSKNAPFGYNTNISQFMSHPIIAIHFEKNRLRVEQLGGGRSVLVQTFSGGTSRMHILSDFFPGDTYTEQYPELQKNTSHDQKSPQTPLDWNVDEAWLFPSEKSPLADESPDGTRSPDMDEETLFSLFSRAVGVGGETPGDGRTQSSDSVNCATRENDESHTKELDHLLDLLYERV